VAFSPREPLLAIGFDLPNNAAERRAVIEARTPRVLLWDLDARKVVGEISIAGNYSGVSFSDDGRRLVVGSSEGRQSAQVSIWRVSDGANLATWPGAEVRANTGDSRFAVNRDASAAAVVNGRSQISMIDLATGKERWSTTGTEDIVGCLAFSPDGSILASGAKYADAIIRLWDGASGRSLGQLEGQRGWTSGLVFLADGKHLLSSSADQTIRLWDLETRAVVRTYRGHKTEIHALGLSANQQTVISGGKDGAAYVWNLDVDRAAAAKGSFNGLSWTFRDNGNSIISVSRQGGVTRRSGRQFEQSTVLVELGELAQAPVFHPTRPLIAATDRARKLQVWDWDRGVLIRELTEGDTDGVPIPWKLSADGSRVWALLPPSAAPAATPKIREWEITSGRIVRTHDFSNLPAIDLAVSTSDENRVFLVARGNTGTSFFLDLQTGGTTPIKYSIATPGSEGAFTHDDTLAAVPSEEGFVQLFDPIANQVKATLRGFMFGAHSAAFSPDGSRLVIGSTGSEAVTIWDRHSHERLLTLSAFASTLIPIGFSPDGNVLIGRTYTGADGGMLYFWRAPTWDEIGKAESGAKP
jgi:WD40 repeat protein